MKQYQEDGPRPASTSLEVPDVGELPTREVRDDKGATLLSFAAGRGDTGGVTDAEFRLLVSGFRAAIDNDEKHHAHALADRILEAFAAARRAVPPSRQGDDFTSQVVVAIERLLQRLGTHKTDVRDRNAIDNARGIVATIKDRAAVPPTDCEIVGCADAVGPFVPVAGHLICESHYEAIRGSLRAVPPSDASCAVISNGDGTFEIRGASSAGHFTGNPDDAEDMTVPPLTDEDLREFEEFREFRRAAMGMTRAQIIELKRARGVAGEVPASGATSVNANPPVVPETATPSNSASGTCNCFADAIPGYDGHLLSCPESVRTPTGHAPSGKCPCCGSEKIAPTRGNAVGNTMDCLVCGHDFTPVHAPAGLRSEAER